MVPFNLQMEFWRSFEFWIGLVFVTFPLNFLVYGLNDFNDFYADTLNKRKGNFLFGAISSEDQLRKLPVAIFVVVSPFIICFTFLKGWEMFLLLVFMILINIAYNFPPLRLKERPPFEIIIQIGYVFTALFSIVLNDLEILPWQTFLYLTLFAFQAHIAGEIMDIEPDKNCGKRTTATIIGRRLTKIIMLMLLLIETSILFFWFNDYVLGGFLAMFSIWFVFDTFYFFKSKPYSIKQMKLFGIAMNVSAILSMIWILYSGKLLQPVI